MYIEKVAITVKTLIGMGKTVERCVKMEKGKKK